LQGALKQSTTYAGVSYPETAVNQSCGAILYPVFRKNKVHFLCSCECSETFIQTMFEAISGFRFLNQTINNALKIPQPTFVLQNNPYMSITKEKLDFTQRELEVLHLIKEGLSSREIAKAMDMSENTVETYRRNMIKKSGAKNMVVVVYAAQSCGLI
jgi:DNA-binding NarL/FixJ family response regulator